MLKLKINKYYLFFIILLLIGLITGYILVFNLSDVNAQIIDNNVKDIIPSLNVINISTIFNHVFLLPFFLILSLFIISYPIYLIYLVFNGFIIGFIIGCFYKLFSFKGLLFGAIYAILSKGIFIILVIILFKTLFKISNIMLYKFINKDKYNVKKVNVLFKKALLIIVFVIISDIILYYGGNYILKVFKFLIN